ncbi:hypothetical protein D3OALGA1CA_4608 [Olavius algarvensis associated proteobacterium Delta 3]|nr:hypothetical protein D3OALGB2SA_2604 [Olavius algarvensis associated proteobacterium Delta 3]CAB5154104.1 hypothetical protein D3OALGA1CA_4608 [Olavius algarvensis associated proteobacterium Delta 3]
MPENRIINRLSSGEIPVKIAIVGGGRACRYFLELLQQETFLNMKIEIAGVCDIDPEAEGFVMAREMGIFTTDNFHDFFSLDDLDGILELTNSNEVLQELIQNRPKRIAILEHNIGRLFRNLFETDLRLKAAEQQVAHDELVTDFLIKQAKQMIVVLNTDFTIADANKAYLKAIGKSREEAVGKPCYTVMHGLKRPCSDSEIGFGCPMVETLRTGESAHIIREVPRSGDRATYSEIVTYPMQDREGKIVRVIEIWRDITDALSQRVNERLETLKANLHKIVQEDRMISLGKLAASCVHEINNPIQGLLTFSHMMVEMLSAETPSPDERQDLKHYATLMSSELERCGNIISGLLSFSRSTELENARLDLIDVVQAVLALTRHKIELQNIELDLRAPAKPLYIYGDANRLQQCFLNLIFNAVEAMPEGGRLSIELRETDEWACLEITDSGYGIPADSLDHIYDPFFSTKNSGEGTGLGLSIVYGVVKVHEGDIAVRSHPGEGTSFTLRFPIVRPTEVSNVQ